MYPARQLSVPHSGLTLHYTGDDRALLYAPALTGVGIYLSNEERGIRTARKAPEDLSESTALTSDAWHTTSPGGSGWFCCALKQWSVRMLGIAGLPVLLVLAGCGGGVASTSSSNGTFSVSPGTSAIDTNCTGCNATSNSGNPVEQFAATLNAGGTAAVAWTVSGGDANSGPGTISTNGQYTPPQYLTANSVQVTVTAALTSSPSTKASATVTVTPGFLQPLTPENVALGGSGTVTVTGYIAESGGSTAISYAVSNTCNRLKWRTRLSGLAELHAEFQRIHLLHRHLHRSRHNFCERHHLCGRDRRHVDFKDCDAKFC